MTPVFRCIVLAAALLQFCTVQYCVCGGMQCSTVWCCVVHCSAVQAGAKAGLKTVQTVIPVIRSLDGQISPSRPPGPQATKLYTKTESLHYKMVPKAANMRSSYLGRPAC